MSQWNNSYNNNNQYQPPTNSNDEYNNQHANQSNYPNPNRQYDHNRENVNVDEFLSQMHLSNASSSNYANTQLNNVPSYHNGAAAQSSQSEYMSASNTANFSNNEESYQLSTQNQYNVNPVNENKNNDTSEVVFKSKLTSTATEFVPKNSQDKPDSSPNKETVQESNSSSTMLTESSSNFSKPSSSTNLRERPQSSHHDSTSSFLENNSFQKSRPQETNNFEGGQSKHSKAKNKESDVEHPFHSSSMPKESEDVRNGRESHGKDHKWAGCQRVRTGECSYVEDEQYANSYLQYREEKNRDNVPNSPMKGRHKLSMVSASANTDMTQRESLSEQLDKGTLECVVCCDRVKQTDPVWYCGNCYHVFHLRCIRKWAMSSMDESKWRCPACQNTNQTIPTEYRCMCGAVRNPVYKRGSSGAHTCGLSCTRPRNCPHSCTLLCHPGPCPPCQATVSKQCGCCAETHSVFCSSKLPQVCGRECRKKLECGVHSCKKDCHEGPCDACGESVIQVCHCTASIRSVPCTTLTGPVFTWSCSAECGRVLACGAHLCPSACHAPPCALCPLRPDNVKSCPCGGTRIHKDQRKSCTDPIPLCGNICSKPFPCGPLGNEHFCMESCHDGACRGCPDTTLLKCRCGRSSREVPCADLPEMYNNVLCQKKCNKMLSCGRHRCRTACCAATSHRCTGVCGRTLSCQRHNCEEFCHIGHCAPCARVSLEELRCECGTEVILPPVRCGTKLTPCSAPCHRRRTCDHPPHHACHYGDCPPCVVLTTKRCYGDHEERKTIPCFQEQFSCGLPCGKPLPCGKHTCLKKCHTGPCDTGKCTQPCTEKRPSCGHPCAAPCHTGSVHAAATTCPSAAPCRRPVRATCPCSRRTAERACCDNARDYAKTMSTLAALKIQECGTVDLSDPLRPENMLKTLECDAECLVEARSQRSELALQIRNPDLSAKLAPCYSKHVRATAVRDPAFAQLVHDRLTDLVQLAQKSKQKTRTHSFPSMNRQKRQFIHELCEHFGCESVAYDAEPNRNVVATADKKKSWLPAMSVLDVLAREAGKRRVPGPILSAPPFANTAAAGSSRPWARLASNNAWAASSQSEAKQEPKIDYFDNPPEN